MWYASGVESVLSGTATLIWLHVHFRTDDFDCERQGAGGGAKVILHSADYEARPLGSSLQ